MTLSTLVPWDRTGSAWRLGSQSSRRDIAIEPCIPRRAALLGDISKRFSEANAHSGNPVIVALGTDKRSAPAAQTPKQAGLQNLCAMLGGMEQWNCGGMKPPTREKANDVVE